MLLLLALLLPSCSTPSHRLHQGMTKDQVSAKLGQPIRVVQKPGGLESWIYTAVETRRSAGVTQNYDLPGESVYERDLRLDTSGGVASTVDVATIESYEEQPIHFDASGRVLTTPTHSFLARK